MQKLCAAYVYGLGFHIFPDDRIDRHRPGLIYWPMRARLPAVAVSNRRGELIGWMLYRDLPADEFRDVLRLGRTLAVSKPRSGFKKRKR